jgi:hypothetical protein
MVLYRRLYHYDVGAMLVSAGLRRGASGVPIRRHGRRQDKHKRYCRSEVSGQQGLAPLHHFCAPHYMAVDADRVNSFSLKANSAGYGV